MNASNSAPTDVLSGIGVLAGQIFGFASGNAKTGEDVVIVTEGAFATSKVAADAFAIGDPVRFDATTGLMGVAGDKAVGFAIEIAAAGSATVAVRLVPSVA